MLEKYRQAGKIAREVRERARDYIEVEKPLLEIANFVEDQIRILGGKLAFPCNLSINNIAAHYTPDALDKSLLKEDVIKVDFGVHIDGYISDTAFTLDFSGQHEDLKKASEKALEEAIKLCTPGTCVCEIGEVIESTINSFGFKPITNLSGHSLGQYNLHSGMSIPNIPKGEDILEENMAIAIEPFATSGSGYVIESSESSIYRFLQHKPVRSPEARKILELAEREFSRLPFAKRWIDLPPARLNLAIMQLVSTNAIHSYPILKEKTNEPIAQTESTVIVKDKPEVIA